jgi:hypothetical protein
VDRHKHAYGNRNADGDVDDYADADVDGNEHADG